MSAFTGKQVEQFGLIVAGNFGANIQMGFWRESAWVALDNSYAPRIDLEGQPYVATQMSPNERVSFHIVKEDGEVVVL